MKIYECNYETLKGNINHNVHTDWDEKGNLHFSEHDLGDGVKGFWGTDEYEYFFTVHNEHLARFMLCLLNRAFSSDEKLSVKELRDMCDKYEINYSTDHWL